LVVVEGGEQASDFLARTALELGLGGAAFGGQRELVDAAVVLGGLSRHDLPALQCLQGPAHKARIEAEIAGEVGGGTGKAMPDLVDDAGFLQSEGAVQQLRLDEAELAGIEAVERADRRYLAVGFLCRHGAP